MTSWDKIEKFAEQFDLWTANLKIRFQLMSRDLLFFVALLAPFFALITIISVLTKSKPPFIFINLMFSAFFLNKDFFYAQSPAKIIYGFKVVKLNEQNASPLQCLIRNLTTIFWPIEVLISIFSPYRRLGDWIAGTKLIKIEPNLEESFLKIIKKYRWESRDYLYLFVNLFISFIFIYGFYVILKAINLF